MIVSTFLKKVLLGDGKTDNWYTSWDCIKVFTIVALPYSVLKSLISHILMIFSILSITGLKLLFIRSLWSCVICMPNTLTPFWDHFTSLSLYIGVTSFFRSPIGKSSVLSIFIFRPAIFWNFSNKEKVQFIEPLSVVSSAY